jgi:hypothetical protein
MRLAVMMPQMALMTMAERIMNDVMNWFQKKARLLASAHLYLHIELTN